MDIDDIVDFSQTEQKKFDKDEWAKKKQAEKKELYDLLNQTIEEIKLDSEKLKQYLNVQSQFDRYSVNNALLISAQMPTATKIKEYHDWRKLRAFVKKEPKQIKILEPGAPYERSDGSVAVSYNLKKMIDISQTNVKEKKSKNEYDSRILLKSFLNTCHVNVLAIDTLESGRSAEWNPKNNTLYICRGMNTTTMFNDLSKELAKISMESTNTKLDEFKANCVSYLICKKYNIDVSSYHFDESLELFSKLEVADVKNILTDIRQVMEDIDIRINNSLENVSKKKKPFER